MTPLALTLNALEELFHTLIALYFIYSMRMFLTARLEKFPPQEWFPRKEEVGHAAD